MGGGYPISGLGVGVPHPIPGLDGWGYQAYPLTRTGWWGEYPGYLLNQIWTRSGGTHPGSGWLGVPPLPGLDGGMYPGYHPYQVLMMMGTQGTPATRSGPGWGYPIPGLDGRGTPIPGLDGGGTWDTSDQVWMVGGYPGYPP